MSEETTNQATEETQATTQEVERTQEDIAKEWLGTDEGKKYLQPQLDSYFTKGLQTWQEKNIDKIKDEARTEVKNELEKQIEDLNTSLTANRINSELKLKLLSEGADKEDVDLLMRAVDISKVSVDDDKIIGLNDVVSNLKESRPKWFTTQQQQTTAKGKDGVPTGNIPPASTGKLNREQINKLPDNERIKYKRDNPDWWKQ